MKPVGIITDSCSGISQKEASERGIFVLPMPFYIEGHCLYEGVDLDRDEFLEKLKEGADVSTSQPSPVEVTALWDRVLSEYEKVLYMPISSGLSGSCETAYAPTRDERGESPGGGPRPGGDASAPYGPGRAGAGGKGVYG